MSRKPVTLWKPEEAETSDQDAAERGYALCASGLCTNVVGHPGQICEEHRQPTSHDRSPGNHILF